MPNEAKFGLVVGLVLVVLVAVVFFRRDTAQARSGETTSAAVKPAAALPASRAARTSSTGTGRGQRQAAKEESPFRPGAGVLPRQRSER